MVTKAGESAAIFFLVLSSFAANVVAPTTSELEDMYAAAAQELNAEHYREALQKLDAIDARQPDMAAAQHLRGVAWMRLGEYRKAETALRKAREIDPDFWEARFNLAEMPFLSQDWTEARRRFTALAAEPNDHLQGATSDLIQFKILLTLLLEGKEQKAAPILAKIKASPEDPAFYYVQAALALRHKDRQEGKRWMATATKKFSPQVNKLYAESFYEVGWLPKPEGATPVALEITSPAERLARAQADLARAERAYRRRDLEGAWQLLDQVDATSPNQAVTYNLRGEILLDQGRPRKRKRLCATRWRRSRTSGSALQPGAGAFCEKRLRDRAQGIGSAPRCNLRWQGKAERTADPVSDFFNPTVGRARRRGAEGDGRVQDDGRLASLVLRAGGLGFRARKSQAGKQLGGQREQSLFGGTEPRFCRALLRPGMGKQCYGALWVGDACTGGGAECSGQNGNHAQHRRCARQTRGKSTVSARRGAIQADNSRPVAETDTRSFNDTGEGRGRGGNAKTTVNRFNENGDEAFDFQEVHRRR